MKKKNDPNFKVNITQIIEINPHPDPETHSLKLAKVYGFEVVINAFSGYNIGDKVVYLPVNSVLPADLERELFPPDSKIKLEKARIKAVRIRKFVSQGMIVKWDLIKKLYNLKELPLETDIQDVINVVKYQPPVVNVTNSSEKKVSTPRNKPHKNPYFKQYNGCTNIKWEPYAFKPTDRVYITEKIHGSNIRFGWLPYKPTTFFEKVKKFFGLAPRHEFCYGSNIVQRQRKQNSPTWYKEDVYAKAISKYNMKELSKKYPNHVFYGEIYGPSIQKGYHYGLKNDEVNMIIFDIMIQEEKDQRWLSWRETIAICNTLGIHYVPFLYVGEWNEQHAVRLASGNSYLCKDQKVVEGVVVKNAEIFDLTRKKIKIINPEYLMKEATGETTDNTEMDNENGQSD